MQGQPLLQVLTLLTTLVGLGVLGHAFTNNVQDKTPAPPSVQQANSTDTQSAEIELIFSSLPKSYTLKRPSEKHQDGEVILTSQADLSNPCYEEINVTMHQDAIYWIDVVWENQPTEGSRHGIQINISPELGKRQTFSYFSSSAQMQETFEYSGENHE